MEKGIEIKQLATLNEKPEWNLNQWLDEMM
jgi:hypothetical protein